MQGGSCIISIEVAWKQSNDSDFCTGIAKILTRGFPPNRAPKSQTHHQHHYYLQYQRSLIAFIDGGQVLATQ
eukprot:scaffold4817_cov123-Skeletonema_dohrnii-CCMP3373.AAC.9